MSAAAEKAEFYIAAIHQTERHLADSHPFAEGVIALSIRQALGDDSPGTWQMVPAPPTDSRLHRAAVYAAHDAAVRRLWQRNRVVYSIDPDLWEALGDISTDAVIPAGLLVALPHPDPFIALPSPLLLPVGGGEQMSIGGFFVTGAVPVIGGQAITSTHADHASGDLTLLFLAEVLDAAGRRKEVVPGLPDLIMSRVTLNVSTRDATVGELIDMVLARFDAIPRGGNPTETTPRMITAALSALIYLCARNAELRPLPAAVSSRAAARRGQAKPPREVLVGTEIGAQLRAWRRSEAAAGGGGGGGVRPHIRRAHPHTYWVGPGRREREVKFLWPTRVNLAGDATRTTVVSVSEDD